jgi:hypothetical protein
MPEFSEVEIQNARLVTDIFGCWPSFHDAEVHSVLLERGGKGQVILEARINLLEVTSKVDANGRYVLDHNSLVTLRFTQIVRLQITDFNRQNVLSSLMLTRAEEGDGDAGRWKVVFASSYGINAEFGCGSIAVCAITPLPQR